MAVVFIDGFDHYDVSIQSRKWTTSTATDSFVAGRNGGLAMNFTTSEFIEKVFTATSQAWRVGFAFKIIDVNLSAAAFRLVSIKDGVSSQVELTLNPSRQFQFSRNGTLVGSAGSTTLLIDTWYYIEFYVSIKDSINLGNAQMYINGVQELNLSGGTDIKNTANAYGDRVNFSGGGFWDFYLDDVVISQEADSPTPTLLGDRKVATLYPDGNGNYSEFVGSDSDSTNNYLLVDDSTNNDADYVTSDVVSNKDSYTFTNLTLTPTSIDAVQITGNMRKDDAGSRNGRLFTRIGGTDYEGSDIVLSESFVMYSHLMIVDPDTTSAWNNTAITNIEAGVKVQS